MLGRVLVVDDEKNIAAVVQAILERAQFTPVVFTDSAKALRAIESGEDLDAVITDLYMPKVSGLEILESCKKNRPDLPVVMITAFGTVEAAVSSLKSGAFDFITKPFDQDELLNAVRKAVSTHVARQKEISDPNFSITGTGPEIQEVIRLITKVAPSPTTVLIEGESGTGKELAAVEIHRLSARATKPFIKVNCAAIPATLMESELFGHEKGAFTGAVSAKPGRFELAHEGTLFLDEIGEMPLEMQVKLLRVLQEHEFERVGGVQTLKVDVRLIAATNRRLSDEVKAGRFREDLFYRLNVVPIGLPSLRERRADIPALAQTFLKRFNQKLRKNVEGFSPELMAILQSFAWPGNIRQLENTVERMVVMTDGRVLCSSDLPEGIRPKDVGSLALDGAESDQDPSAVDFKGIVRRQTQAVERDLIERALEDTEGNVTKAAEKLGLSRKGLQLKMKELGLRRDSRDLDE